MLYGSFSGGCVGVFRFFSFPVMDCLVHLCAGVAWFVRGLLVTEVYTVLVYLLVVQFSLRFLKTSCSDLLSPAGTFLYFFHF